MDGSGQSRLEEGVGDFICVDTADGSTMEGRFE